MKLVSSNDGPDAVARHNAQAKHKPIKDRHPPRPIVSDDPVRPFEGYDVPEPTETQLEYAAIVNEWRRYDRRISGEIVTHDGLTTGQTEQVDGLLIKMSLKTEPCWMVMDDGKLYRLGNRAYAGT